MKHQYVLTGVEVLLAVGSYLQKKGAMPNTPPDQHWVIRGNVAAEYAFTVEFVDDNKLFNNNPGSEPEKVNKLLTENVESSWKEANEAVHKNDSSGRND